MKRLLNIRFLLALSLLVRGSSIVGAQEATEEIVQPAPSLAGEAATATVGRVFGVEDPGWDVEYHVLELTAHSPANASVRSLLVPGWGQVFNRQHVKGALFFATALGAAYGAVRQYDESKDAHDDYVAKGVANDALFDKYERRRAQSFVLVGAAAVIWLSSVVDAYRNAYSPLWSKAPNLEVVLGSDSAQLKMSKRFE